jgi:hypothetical protein
MRYHREVRNDTVVATGTVLGCGTGQLFVV